MKAIILPIFLFILFIVPLLFQSCTKTGKIKMTTVKGKVTNKITGAGVPAVPLEILECETGFYSGADRCTTIASIITDNNGIYQVSFEASSKNFYKVGVSYNNKVEATPNYSNNTRITIGVVNEINFARTPLKILQLRLKV